MADEARLVFELIDRSSPGGNARNAPASGQGTAGAETTVVQDFNAQANQAGGAGSLAEGKNANSDKPRWRGTPPPAAPREVPGSDLADVPGSSSGGPQAISASELRRVSQFQPPTWAPPGPQADDNEARSVMKQAAGAAAQILGIGGPVGSAAGAALQQLASAVPPSMMAAVPALAAASPYVLAGLAAAAIPAAGLSVLNSAANAAREDARGLSPELAEAEAQAQVRQIMANIRTARRLGPELADFVEARSELSAAAQGFRDKAIEGPLDTLNGNMKLLSKTMAAANKLMDKVPQEISKQLSGSAFANILNSVLPANLGTLLQGTGALGNLLGKEDDASMIGWFRLQPWTPLPHPFSETGEDAEGGSFAAIPGLEL